MKITKQHTSVVVEHVYNIDHPTQGIMFYKEWIDSETGKCIDFVLRDFNGHDIDDDALIEEIQEQIDNLNL
jgi:hypothetical protein